MPSRHSDLSLCLWGPWSLNVLTMFFVFLWVRGPARYENTQCYFSVGLPQTVCAFVRLILDNILQQYVPWNTVGKFYPNCLLLLLWKISDQMCPWTWEPSLNSWRILRVVSHFNLSVLANETLSVSLCREIDKTFLTLYEHVLITCCLSFQVFHGSIFYF